MKFKMSFIFEIIKCVHEVILSQRVLDAIRVNMDLTLSVLRIDFYLYRLIARNMPLSEISSLGEKFCELPGSMLDKFKRGQGTELQRWYSHLARTISSLIRGDVNLHDIILVCRSMQIFNHHRKCSTTFHSFNRPSSVCKFTFKATSSSTPAKVNKFLASKSTRNS